jgi:hypothetical protein
MNTGTGATDEYHIYAAAFAASELALAALAKYLVDDNETATFIAANLMLALALVYYMVRPHSGLSRHFGVVAVTLLYQLYFYTRDIAMPTWFSAVPVVCMGIQVCAENMLVLRAARPRPVDKRSDEERLLAPKTSDLADDLVGKDDFTWYYATVGTVPFLVWIAVPMAHGGLFHLSWSQILLLVAIWSALALTESHKRRRLEAKSFVVPHEAVKCAPLLYLPAYTWWAVVALVVFNLYITRQLQWSNKSNV